MNETDGALARFAAELAPYGRLAAPEGLRSHVRAELLAVTVVLPADRPSLWTRVLGLRTALPAMVIVALLAAATGSAAAASLPGDPAFALKRAAEEAQVALTLDDAAKLDTLVAQSDRRLVELETVAVARPTALDLATDEYLAAAARVDAQLALVAAAAPSPARDAALARARAASAAHLASLTVLAAHLPPAAQPGIERAIEAQEVIHGRSPAVPERRGPPSVSPTHR